MQQLLRQSICDGEYQHFSDDSGEEQENYPPLASSLQWNALQGQGPHSRSIKPTKVDIIAMIQQQWSIYSLVPVWLHCEALRNVHSTKCPFASWRYTNSRSKAHCFARFWRTIEYPVSWSSPFQAFVHFWRAYIGSCAGHVTYRKMAVRAESAKGARKPVFFAGTVVIMSLKEPTNTSAYTLTLSWKNGSRWGFITRLIWSLKCLPSTVDGLLHPNHWRVVVMLATKWMKVLEKCNLAD